MKSNIFIFIALFGSLLHVNAQTSEEEKAFIKSLIDKEYFKPQQPKEVNVSVIPYSVSLDDEGDPYTVYFSIIAHEDLNSDGVRDYIIFRNSEGMLGGNVHSNQQYIYYIMKNETEIDITYVLQGYAPFSNNIITDTDYKNKILTAEITQNFRVYPVENLQSTTAHFIYKDDNLYEQSYLSDCELAKMKDKTIFKPDLEVERETGIDINDYTAYHNEKYEKGDTLVWAYLTGCDNFSLNFNISIKVDRNIQFDQKQYDEVLLNSFNFLIENTRYKSMLKKALAKHKENLKAYTTVYTEGTARQGKFSDTWSYFIAMPRPYQDILNSLVQLRIELHNTINPKQEDNHWAVTSRQK